MLLCNGTRCRSAVSGAWLPTQLATRGDGARAIAAAMVTLAAGLNKAA
jgi:hypothetical protein